MKNVFLLWTKLTKKHQDHFTVRGPMPVTWECRGNHILDKLCKLFPFWKNIGDFCKKFKVTESKKASHFLARCHYLKNIKLR